MNPGPPARGNYLLLLLAVLLSLPLLAQTGTDGSFFGTVLDSSGAAVPRAEITIKQLNTGLTKTVAADETGNFAIPALPIGPYFIGVRSKGFKRWELSRTELTVGDRSRLSPVLTVGDVAETVAVEATAEVLQTEKTSVETVVQMRQIRELPLATRNPLALVALVPGMRWESTQDGGERATYIQGQGLRNNKAGFQLDGLNSNAPMDEGGTAIPNVDTIAEFNVQTMNFTAESGRNPMQVLVVTKSGTNNLHGAAWEFVQNDAFNARNTFSPTIARVRRNQFGAAVGGPILKNKTFFFGAYEGTIIRNARIYNSLGVTPAMKTGDFSALSKTIIDPLTKQPFPGNRIPADRISSASKYFLPLILEPNSSDGFFKQNASAKNDTHEGTLRIDHMITSGQRVYGRWVTVRQPQDQLGYVPNPSITGFSQVKQDNIGANYSWTVSPNILFTASAGVMRTNSSYTNPSLGKQNDVLLAGIQGIPTAGREAWIGPPDISFANGYTGVSFPGGWGVPGYLKGDVRNGKVAVSAIRGRNTLAAGFEYGDWHTFGEHGSAAARGSFAFNNLYTNDGFADYLLGYASSSNRNDPLTKFGTDKSPYAAGYIQDTWRVRSNLTLELGIRYERWLARHNVNDVSSTWDPKRNIMVTAVDSNGKPNLTAFAVTPYLAAATKGLFITAREAGIPDGLYEPNGNWAPRLGAVYRPFKNENIIIRGGYGIFYNSYTGNRGASTVNIPHWSLESLSFSPTTLQRWETMWPASPTTFGPGTIYAPAYNLRPARTHEWNFTVQTALPGRTALTVAYVGTLVGNEVGVRNYNEATTGLHTNLQADRPFPAFASIQINENFGRNWYNALQTKVERRYSTGLAFTVSYSFSRSMMSNTPDCETCALTPYSPDWYNRGRTSFDRRHIEYATVVWEAPFGRGKKFGTQINRVVDLIAGGWQLNVTQQGQSGAPLSISAGTPSLGNSWTPRANIVGNPGVSNPSPALWFNTAAFAAPPAYVFGNSGIGIIEGPGNFAINTGLTKNFHATESKYFQFRFETFNTTNRVNYNNPSTSLTSATYGRITSAGSSRYMQLGLKFLF
ncbi:TonB-dependent receptor [Bryobacter aggregatus]|uniref:TonB-dependent receptor n=1 Tax=Bryobacter aggregatus TaxID=360054 RepID=UPI0004E229F0|nr:carboxypeptidase-like regulatory domain-containing protein [Bryobacter aggregatus]